MAMSTTKPWTTIIVVFTALLMGSLSSAAWTPAQQPQPAVQKDSGKLMLQFENAELYDFINQIATTLGITPIIIDPDVKGSVTLMSSSPMSKDDVFPLFNMILKNNNAALIKQGDVYQIIPIAQAVKRGVDVIEHLPPTPPEAEKPPAAKPTEPGAKKEVSSTQGGPAAKAGPFQAAPKAALASPPAAKAEPEASKIPRLSTHVIRPEFVPVKDLIEPIKLLISDGGVIMTYDRLNMLILTDYSDNADRILQIIHMLDNKYIDDQLMDLVHIKNNAASDVADDLKKIFGSGTKDSATAISFVPLERLNAIFVMASSKRGLSEVKKWIAQLDSESGRNIQTYIYVVENSTASNIAMMLSALYGGEGSGAPAQGGGTTGGGVGAAQTGAFGTSGAGMAQGATNTPFGNVGSYQGGYGGGYGGYQSGMMGGMGGGFMGGGMGGGYMGGGMGGGYMGGGVFGGGQQLGPHLNVSPTISSQVLRGGAFTGLQDTVRLVVDDINNSLVIQATAADYAYLSDTIRKMDVLPRQAIIDARIFEVDLTDALSFGINAALQAKTGSNMTTGAIDPATGALSASTFAFVGDSRQILMNLNALREKTKVRILEAPSVLALDGQMASIMVGSEIAYPGSSFTTTVGSTTSVQYRDTGISLMVLPRISASGSVTLDVYQEVSSPGSSNTYGPSFTVTDVQTTLSVKDGETVAIAGLMRDHNSYDRFGVPILSQLPLLGALFGGSTRNTLRTELIIMLTPHVIRTPEKFQERSQELMDSLRHVRTFADEKDKEHREDMENARKDRYQQEQKKN